MANYVYRCKACLTEFEEFGKIKNRNDKRQCPYCGTWEIHNRLIQAPYFKFEGGLPSYDKENREIMAEAQMEEDANIYNNEMQDLTDSKHNFIE